MDKKTLTISVAAYNVEDCLGRCLDAFIDTDVFNDLEIIVVNDGSKDSTASLAASYAEKYPDVIRLIDKENGGHGSTINASIKAASAAYYKVVDADDWVDKEGLERLISFLKKTDADLVINPYRYIDAASLAPRSVRTPFNENIRCGMVMEWKDAADDVYMEMHALTYKTGVVKSMGPVIDEKCFYVDIEYALLSLEHVKTLVCLDWPVYQYLVGSSEQSVNSDVMVRRRAQHLRVFERLACYYEESKDRLEDKTRMVILSRLRYMAMSHYKIIFRTETARAKKEIAEFDSWLKAASPEIYEGPNESAMKAVRVLRKTRFRLYGPFIAAMKTRWKMKGQSDII